MTHRDGLAGQNAVSNDTSEELALLHCRQEESNGIFLIRKGDQCIIVMDIVDLALIDLEILIQEALKDALKGTDTAAIKAKSEDLQKAMYAVSEKVYAAAQAAQQAADPNGNPGNPGNGGNDGYVDADFKEV